MKHTPTAREIAAFMARVNKDGPWLCLRGRCWVWTGSQYKNGYGRFWWRDKHIRAHRFSYIIWIDNTLPGDLNVLHRCDNPLCIRPPHLYGGSLQDNVDDMWKRKRAALGLDLPHTKLSDDDVRHIRSAHNTFRGRPPKGTITAIDLAKEFNVHPHTIHRIWSRDRRSRI